MPNFITMPQVGIIIDTLYRNYSKPRFEQKNVNLLAKDCGVSVQILLKVRKIMVVMQLLIVDGERAAQKCYWNTVKSKPNPVMLTEVYRVYTKDAKSRVKVEIKKEKRLPSEQLALLTFKKKGALKVTVEYVNSYKRTIEVFDIAQMEEE